MEKNLVKFDFNGSSIQTIIDDKGEPWWVAKDVCDVLGLTNPTEALRSLDDDEKNTLRITEGIIQGNPNKAIISESGLYSLIMRSRKPDAKAFKKWITSEVLPSIRKTGSYGADPIQALNDPATMRSLLLTYSEKVIELQPKADGYDLIAGAEGSTCLRDTAKALQVRPTDLILWLSSERWIYKRVGCASWIGYQDKIQQSLLIHKVNTLEKGDGTEKIVQQVRITPKGIAKLSVVFGGA